jgi:hypothetical protein
MGHAVPAFGHLEAGGAQTRHDPAVGEVVRGRGRGRWGRRRAGWDLRDRRAEPKAAGQRGAPGQRPEDVRA